MAGEMNEGTTRDGEASREPSTPVSGPPSEPPSGARSQPAQDLSTQDGSAEATSGASHDDDNIESPTPKPRSPAVPNPDEADQSFSSSVDSNGELAGDSTFSPAPFSSSPMVPPTPEGETPSKTPQSAAPPRKKSYAAIVASPVTTPTPSRDPSQVRGRSPALSFTPRTTPASSRPVSLAGQPGGNNPAPSTPVSKSSSMGPGGRNLSRGRGGGGGSQRGRPSSMLPSRAQSVVRDQAAPTPAETRTLDALRDIWRNFARAHHIELPRRHSTTSGSEETPSTAEALFKDAMTQLAAEFAQRDTNLEETRSEASQARADLKNEKSEREKTTTELDKMRSKLETTTSELEKTRSEREKTQLELDQAKSGLEQAAVERDQLLKDKQSLEDEMKDKDAKIREVTEEAEKAKQAHQSLVYELNETRKQLNETVKQKDAKIQEVTEEANKAKEAQQAQQSSYDKLNASLEEKDVKIKELTTEAATATQALDKLNETLQQKDVEVQQMTAAAKETKQAHESSLKELKDALEEKDDLMKKAVDDAEKARQACESSRTELNEALEAKEKAINEAEGAEKARNSAYDDLEKATEEHAKTNAELEATKRLLDEAMTERDAKDVELQKSAKTIGELQQKKKDDEPSVDVDELRAKLSSLRDELIGEQKAKDAAERELNSLRLIWQQEEAKYRKCGDESDEMMKGLQGDAEKLRGKIRKLEEQLEVAVKRAVDAKSSAPVFLVDNEEIPLSKYEKLLGNARGETADLKRQLQEAREERENASDIPLDKVREIVEPYLKLYGIAFEDALEAMEHGMREEDESLEAFINPVGVFQPHSGAVVDPDVEKAPSQASSSVSALMRGEPAPAPSEFGSQASQASPEVSPRVSSSRNLRSELGLSRETSTLSDMSGRDDDRVDGLTLTKCREFLIHEVQRCRDLQAEKRKLDSEVEKLRTEAAGLNEAISVHEKAAKQLKRQLDQAAADKAALQEELDAKERIIASERKRLRDVEARLNDATNNRIHLENEIEGLKSDLDVWRDSGDLIGKDNLALQKIITEKDEKIGSLEISLRAAKHEVSNERERRVQAETKGIWKGTSGKALKDRENKISELEARINADDQEARAHKAEIKKLKAEIQRSLEATDEEVSRARDSARDALTQTENTLGELGLSIGDVDKVVRLLKADDQIIGLLHQAFTAPSPDFSISIGSSSNADTNNNLPPPIDEAPLDMDIRDYDLLKLRELIAVRQKMADLRAEKDQAWFETRGPMRHYAVEMLETELNTVEEMLMAARAGRRHANGPENNEEALLRTKNKVLENIDLWNELYRERDGAIRENIEYYGGKFNELFCERPPLPRPLEVPPPTPSTKAPSTVAEAPLPPDTRPTDSHDKWNGEPKAYDEPARDDSSSSGSDGESEAQAALSTGLRRDVENALQLLDKLQTSVNIALQLAAGVQNIKEELAQEVMDDGTFAGAERRASHRSMGSSSGDLSASSSSAGNASGESSVFSRSKRGGHIASILPLRLGGALQRWYIEATATWWRLHELKEGIESLARHTMNAERYDFLRTTARKLKIELREASERLREQQPKLTTERETHLLGLIEKLQRGCQKLQARLIEKDQVIREHKGHDREMASLRAEVQVKSMVNKILEEDRSDAMEEKTRVADYLNATLKSQLEDAESRVLELEGRLAEEVATKARPVKHLTDRVRKLEGEVVVAQRHLTATENQRNMFFAEMERVAGTEGGELSDRMKAVMNNSFHPDPFGERALQLQDLESNDQAVDENLSSKERDLAQEVLNMKKLWRIQEDRMRELDEGLQAQERERQERWDEAYDRVVMDREARQAQTEAQLDLSERNRIEALERQAELRKRVEQLEKEIELAYELKEAGQGSGPSSSSSSSSSSSGSDSAPHSPRPPPRDSAPGSPRADDGAAPPEDGESDERPSPPDDAAGPPAEQPDQPDQPEAAQDAAAPVTESTAPVTESTAPVTESTVSRPAALDDFASVSSSDRSFWVTNGSDNGGNSAPASAGGRSSTGVDLHDSVTSLASSGLRSRKKSATNESGDKVTSVEVEEEPTETESQEEQAGEEEVSKTTGSDIKPPAAKPQDGAAKGETQSKLASGSTYDADDDLKKPTKKEKLAYVGGWLTVRASLTDEEAQQYTIMFAWSLTNCLRNHLQAWIWSLWFLVVCAAYVPLKILGFNVDVAASRPRPKHLAVLLVDMAGLLSLVYACKIVFSSQAVRDLWEMANGATRAYYIETQLAPGRSRFLGLNNVDRRLFPGYDEASTVAKSFARTVFRRPVAQTAAARVG